MEKHLFAPPDAPTGGAHAEFEEAEEDVDDDDAGGDDDTGGVASLFSLFGVLMPKGEK
jgi:hypothetical protein